MAKKFMFVCIGILALTVAFLLGAQFGRAEYVDHSTSGIVSARIGGGGAQCLLDNGQVWEVGPGYPWTLCDAPAFPCPVSEIKFWGGVGAETPFVDNNNEFWWHDGFRWRNEGAPPGGLATQPSTWGSIKAQFNK
jgi:hypothetical protein